MCPKRCAGIERITGFSMKFYTFVDYATQAYALFVGLLVLLFHNGTVPHWPAIVAIHTGILLTVHSLIHWHGRGSPPAPVRFVRHFYPVLLYTWFFFETGLLNRMFALEYLDPMVIRWEQALFGCQPSVLFMEKFPSVFVSEIFYAAYFSYYIMIAGVGIALLVRSKTQFFHYISVVSFLFYICYTVYLFLPVIGPRVFFREIAGYDLPEDLQLLSPVEHYPDSVKAGPFFQIMALIYRHFEAPGAALPSSHVAVAICTVFFSFRYLRKIRFLHLAIATLLCLSTVYCRYHYVVDVLAGMITAALVIPFGNWLYFKFGEPLNRETKSKGETVTAASSGA